MAEGLPNPPGPQGLSEVTTGLNHPGKKETQGVDTAWTVVGTGPGTRDYLPPAAVSAVEGAEVVIGSPRALELFALEGKETHTLGPDLSRLVVLLRQRQKRAVAILVSGDPGFFSLLSWLRREFPEQKLRVVPGISSVQMAFARLATSWHDAVFVSLHGRGWRKLDPYLPRLRKQTGLKLAVLTGGKITPAELARYLLQQGVKTRVWVGAALGHPEEQWVETDLDELARRSDFPAAAVVVMGYA